MTVKKEENPAVSLSLLLATLPQAICLKPNGYDSSNSVFNPLYSNKIRTSSLYCQRAKNKLINIYTQNHLKKKKHHEAKTSKSTTLIPNGMARARWPPCTHALREASKWSPLALHHHLHHRMGPVGIVSTPPESAGFHPRALYRTRAPGHLLPANPKAPLRCSQGLPERPEARGTLPLSVLLHHERSIRKPGGSLLLSPGASSTFADGQLFNGFCFSFFPEYHSNSA